MKTVLFVPGYQEDLHSRDYASMIVAIEKQGYRVKVVPINWKRTTIEQWIAELDKVYTTHDPLDTVLAGFSYGAMTAFMSAANRNPSALWLFSLSPYFAEDLKSKNIKAAELRRIGHRRVEAFSKLEFEELTPLVRCKTLLFAGKLEMDKWPDVRERQAAAHRLLEHNELIVIDGAGHNVTDEHYIKAIKAAI